MEIHPVQSLYNICVTNHWYPPIYKFVAQEGPANDRTFTCVVEIHNIQENGTGIEKSKKLSKANAALNLIKKLGIWNANSFCHLNSDSHNNYFIALCDLAYSNGLRLNFFHILDERNSGRKQCLLEILSNPVIVCCGFGDTKEEASNDASMNAMNSLQIVINRFCKT